ncbi:9873_t:CDS:2, partial [Acaulospora colombiana]
SLSKVDRIPPGIREQKVLPEGDSTRSMMRRPPIDSRHFLPHAPLIYDWPHNWYMVFAAGCDGWVEGCGIDRRAVMMGCKVCTIDWENGSGLMELPPGGFPEEPSATSFVKSCVIFFTPASTSCAVSFAALGSVLKAMVALSLSTVAI